MPIARSRWRANFTLSPPGHPEAVIQSLAVSTVGGVARDIDSHGFSLFDAQAFYEEHREEWTGLGDAIFGAIAATLHTFRFDSPSARDGVIYPVGFLALSAAVVRVYFRDPDTLETLGFDLDIVDDAGNYKLVTGTFLWAHIRELIGANSLEGREVDAYGDEYCSRAFSMP